MTFVEFQNSGGEERCSRSLLEYLQDLGCCYTRKDGKVMACLVLELKGPKANHTPQCFSA